MDAIKILDNFIDDQTCDYMVEVYKRLFENVPKWKDGRKLLTNPKDKELYEFLKIYMPKISETLGKPYYIRDLLLSIYEVGAFVKPHVDFTDEKLQQSLGILFYFNDDFEGGEVYFVNFPFKYKPKKGTALIFPCNNKEYKHGVKPITSGTRYTMPIEINSDKSLEMVQL